MGKGLRKLLSRGTVKTKGQLESSIVCDIVETFSYHRHN